MSLPLKRRMARVALLVAAAAPVIGMGAASASAAGLPQVSDLGGLSTTDAASNVGGNVDGAAHQAVGVVDKTGSGAAKTLVPAAGQTVAGTGKTLAPVAKNAVGQVGSTAKSGGALSGGVPVKGLPGV